jgi:hypothetical protein
MKTLDPWKERGLKMVEDLPRRVNGYLVTPPTRWTKAKNGRLLPLNSAAWNKLRRQVLNEVPLCQYCPPGAITPATEVDHKNNNPADNSRDNLVSTCKPCHSVKTMADMHGRPARMGCDESGNPINPSHHWNEATVGGSGALAGDVEHGKSPAADGRTPTCSPCVNANRGNEP